MPFLASQSEFHLGVRSWASTFSSVEGDEYGILTTLPFLAFAYDHVCKTPNDHSKEHIQRRSIDDIMELAFSTRLDRHCDFEYVFSLQAFAFITLPLELNRVTALWHRLATQMQSDALVTIPSGIVDEKIQLAWQSFHGDPILRHLYWSTGGDDDNFSIIGFAGEFKKDDKKCNENQLIMVLATAQAQRKALLLKPSIIMGGTTCRGHVQIFSSYWSNHDPVCS